MTKEELLNRLSGIARRAPMKACQRSPIQPVAICCFGVKENRGQFEVKGVIEIEKVHSDFVNTLDGTETLSKIIYAKCDQLDCDGSKVREFYIPEAHRYDKPMYAPRRRWNRSTAVSRKPKAPPPSVLANQCRRAAPGKPPLTKEG
jgi:hypothetical protein